MSKVSISIITHSALDHAKRCIASVLANRSGAKLILTAQGNPVAANYFYTIARDNPDVTVVATDKNDGFIIPSRKAFGFCDTEYFVLLNDDTEVGPGWLEALEAPFIKYPSCALSAPVGGHFPKSLNPDKNAIEYLFGWCMMGRTSLLREVGLFSDYIKWAYADEIDLGLRLIAKGYTLHVAHGCNVKHVGKATSAKIPGIKAIERRNFAEVAKRFPQYFGR